MKYYSRLIIILSLTLAGCSTPASVAETETQILPTTTNIPTPTIVPSPTTIPTQTPDPLIFKDDFDEAMDPEWQWEKEDGDMWSLTNNPGWLEIIAGSGGVGSRNLLKRAAPEGDFELETRMTFEPVDNYQIAGLIVFYNTNNYILFGRAYAAQVVGDGLYMDHIASGNFIGDNFATIAPGMDTIYLRLQRKGDTYESFYSEDGNNWVKVGAHTTNMQVKFVGLAAGQSTRGTVPAQFDYFLINEIK